VEWWSGGVVEWSSEGARERERERERGRGGDKARGRTEL